ncbi:hypothetical protein HanXRQr2_Chr17g0793491 [Helianthus annuus]|uniref:Uncharacterized protein n=1 Tax=Helianthus annuus TaxID=4232 RepID=A0A9K3DFS1_HELAN|nr:hypothetical protein HanXRQr2_Chr17g0793491 [Helianthus annuus]
MIQPCKSHWVTSQPCKSHWVTRHPLTLKFRTKLIRIFYPAMIWKVG